MVLMVVSKKKLKKILIFILILAFIIGGIAYILKNRTQDTMNLLDMAGLILWVRLKTVVTLQLLAT